MSEELSLKEREGRAVGEASFTAIDLRKGGRREMNVMIQGEECLRANGRYAR